ncbi:MAG: malate synthase A, partial [Deltaproteobacteria bacterium]|nr:malate synthase A [Deltaproteobacteria bacterium]
AQIPIRNDPEANAVATEKVRTDKLREVTAGHDGTWVAHPGLIPVALEVFDSKMPGANQLFVLRNDVKTTAQDLLVIPRGTITEAGLRNNISVGLQYLEAWLRGNGCVPINNLMEDAATAEISRAQLWQWIRHPKGKLESGRKVDAALFRGFLGEELAAHQRRLGAEGFAASQFERAAKVFDEITTSDTFCEFLTLPCYDLILEKGAQ